MPGSEQVESLDGATPKAIEALRRVDGAGQKAEVIQLHHAAEGGFVEVARGGGAMVVHDARAGDEYAGPAGEPGAIAEVEVLDVGRAVALIETAQSAQADGVVERTATGAIEDPGEVLAG